MIFLVEPTKSMKSIQLFFESPEILILLEKTDFNNENFRYSLIN
jgi:hypothetical protein